MAEEVGTRKKKEKGKDKGLDRGKEESVGGEETVTVEEN